MKPVLLPKKNKSIPQLIKILERHFNKYIRLRDKGQKCISCPSSTELQAGHYYPAGHVSVLRFDENNVHGQCLRCNHFLSGNLTKYREGLLEKIGEDKVKDLDRKSKMRGHRWDRYTLEFLIQEYKSKNKKAG